MKEQFYGIGEDAASHMNNFVEFCDMQKYKEVDGAQAFSFLLKRKSQRVASVLA